MPGKNIVTGCTVTNNSANNSGGGVVCESGAVEITNCVISSNSVSINMGGGILSSYSKSTITNCSITGNVANYGGGITCRDSYSSNSISTITNCSITGNAANYGGGIYFDDSSTEIINTTIGGNHATTYGGGISCYYNSSTTVVNSILWGNTAVTDGQEVYLYGTSDAITITFSDINSAYIAGLGSATLSDNINADPLFADSHSASEAPTTAGNYHLTGSSTCIDTGTDDSVTYPNLPVDDIDGNARPLTCEYDMGADEYVCATCCTDCDGDGYAIEGGACGEIDCDDTNPDINPGACDIKKNGIDEDCDGEDRKSGPPC